MHLTLLHTCLIDRFAPDAGMAVVRVLERLGCTVGVPPDQTCCGQPAYNAGFADEARAAARHTVGVLEAAEGTIVIPSGSCGDMVVHQYAQLFEGDADMTRRVRQIASRCREFSSLVAERLAGSPHRPALPAVVAYHPSCHLRRGLGIDREPKAVIDSVADTRRVAIENEDECCGFGGLFAVKHDDISARMLERKLDAIARCGAGRVVTCDLGCLLQIEGGLHRRGSRVTVQHLAELVDEALR